MQRRILIPLSRQQTGFTLIEAVVALVLMAVLGMTLFSWVNTNLIALGRIDELNQRNAATLNITHYMQSVNPMQRPEGKANFGQYEISWKAEPIVQPRDGTGYPRGISLYSLGLYQTRVVVSKLDQPNWFELQLKLVGYTQVRSNRALLF